MKGPVVTAKVRETFAALLFLAPLLALMGLFVFFPLLNTFRLSFYDYQFISDISSFAGLDNYIEWIQDPQMRRTLWISFKFFIYYVPANILLGLLVAILIDRVASERFGTLYRTIFYFPVVLPAAIVFSMWIWIFDPTLGFITLTTKAVGAESTINWLGSPTWALPGLAIMSVWRLMGETVIIMLVGLANIPASVKDAARVDGASEFQLIRRIVLPLLKPMIFVVLVMRLSVLGLIQEPLFMTEGGPIDVTRTYGLHAYWLFFRGDRLGYSSTYFVLLGIISVLLALIFLKWFRPDSD